MPKVKEQVFLSEREVFRDVVPEAAAQQKRSKQKLFAFIEETEGGVEEAGVFLEIKKMDRTIFFLLQDVVGGLRVELGHVHPAKMLGFDTLFLLGLLQHLRKVFSVLELLLSEVVLV